MKRISLAMLLVFAASALAINHALADRQMSPTFRAVLIGIFTNAEQPGRGDEDAAMLALETNASTQKDRQVLAKLMRLQKLQAESYASGVAVGKAGCMGPCAAWTENEIGEKRRDAERLEISNSVRADLGTPLL